MNVLAIGGEPATGKSTLVTRLLEPYTDATAFQFGNVKGTRHAASPGDLLVLGTYDDEGFGGTDRLAMNAITDAEPLLDHVALTLPDATILFEGDRLFNDRFLTAADSAADTFQAYILSAPPNELERRHRERGDGQKDAWLKGRRTKYENLRDHALTEDLDHATPDDHEDAVARLSDLLPDPA